MRRATIVMLALVLGALALAGGADLEPEHARNPVLAGLIGDGLEVAGQAVPLSAPTFRDDQSAEDQRAALRSLAGSDRAVEEMLRDSVTAPHLLRLRDVRPEGAVVRAGDLYFVLHVDLDAIEPRELLRVGQESDPIEAGNMRFEARVLSADDLEGGPVEVPGAEEWYVHTTGRLLDRIAVESTQRVAATRSANSIVIASRTDDHFDVEGRWPNRWAAVDPKQARSEFHTYGGGIGYAKVSRLKGRPGIVVVESHFAFTEPTAWFDGAPILRSKLGLVVQDQVRRLRRELAKEARRGSK